MKTNWPPLSFAVALRAIDKLKKKPVFDKVPIGFTFRPYDRITVSIDGTIYTLKAGPTLPHYLTTLSSFGDVDSSGKISAHLATVIASSLVQDGAEVSEAIK